MKLPSICKLYVNADLTEEKYKSFYYSVPLTGKIPNTWCKMIQTVIHLVNENLEGKVNCLLIPCILNSENKYSR